MSRKFSRYCFKNAITTIVALSDNQDGQYLSCDATGRYANCICCTVVDAAGNEWPAALNIHDVAMFQHGGLL